MITNKKSKAHIVDTPAVDFVINSTKLFSFPK